MLSGESDGEVCGRLKVENLLGVLNDAVVGIEVVNKMDLL